MTFLGLLLITGCSDLGDDDKALQSDVVVQEMTATNPEYVEVGVGQVQFKKS